MLPFFGVRYTKGQFLQKVKVIGLHNLLTSSIKSGSLGSGK